MPPSMTGCLAGVVVGKLFEKWRVPIWVRKKLLHAHLVFLLILYCTGNSGGLGLISIF